MQTHDLDSTNVSDAASSPMTTGLLSDAEVERLGALRAEFDSTIKQGRAENRDQETRERVRQQVEERLRSENHPWADVWAHAVSRDYLQPDAKYRVMLDRLNEWVARITTEKAFAPFTDVTKIDAGSFGVVFRAHHSGRLGEDGRPGPVAIKLPYAKDKVHERDDARIPARNIAQFFVEARRHVGINVRGCVTLLEPHMPDTLTVTNNPDADIDVDKILNWLRTKPIWFSMQLIEGSNLKSFIDGVKVDLSDPKTTKRAISLMTDIARILKELHGHKLPDTEDYLVHKDLKPANILLDRQGNPWLTDFGLATPRSGQLVFGNPSSGSPSYMAPEQWKSDADAANAADTRTDIWAWGAIFSEMLTGKPPYVADQRLPLNRQRQQLRDRILSESPDPPRRLNSNVPKYIEPIIEKCLKRDRGERYRTFGEVLDALDSPTISPHVADEIRGGLERVETKLEVVHQALGDKIDEIAARIGVPHPDALMFDDFRSLMDVVGRDFVGRKWLYDEVEAWSTRQNERALLIKADYGVGKTAFAARLICDGLWNERILAWHFCRYDDRKTLDPIWFIHNLFTMLCNRFPGFSEQAQCETIRQTLVRRRDDPVGAFKDAIIEPLRKIPPPDGVRFLVIDALDEAIAWSRSRNSIVHVLAEATEYFPEWLRLVATTRGETRVLEPLGRLRTHMIDAESQSNLDDLLQYAKLRTADPAVLTRIVAAQQDPESVALCVAEKSEGKFLYAQLVYEALERGNLAPTEIDSLPPGLPGLYERFFQRHYPTPDCYTPAKEILKVLVASLGTEPLTKWQLAHASRLKRNLPTALGALSQYLRERGELVQFQHASLPEWLTQESRHPFSVERRDGHAALAEMCRREFSDDESEWSHYLLAHYPTHLIEASDEFENLWGELADVLSNLRFLEAKAEAGMIFELKADFERSRQCLPKRHPQKRLVELLDEALGLDVQFISRHPSTLFQCLWNRGWWYDAPEAAAHYDIADTDQTSEHLPWNQRGPKLHKLLETWREQKELRTPGFCWLRSMRPAEDSLGNLVRGNIVLSGHADLVNAVVFAPDGRHIASASNDGTIRVWETSSGRESLRLQPDRDRVSCLAYSHDGRWLASGTINDGTVQLWDVQAAEFVREFEVSVASRGCLAFSLDSKRLLSASGGTVKCWELNTGKELRTWQFAETYGIGAESISIDGTFIAQGVKGQEQKHTLHVLDLESGEVVAILRGHNDQVKQVAFSRDGHRVATVSFDKTVRVWELPSGRETHCLKGHEDWGVSVAWSPDGDRLVSGSLDRTLRVWDTRTGEQLVCLTGHDSKILSVAFSPDGRMIASASKDKVVRIWSADSKGASQHLRNHTKQISEVSFSADGQDIVSASMHEESAWIWDVLLGVPRMALPHPDGIFQAVFTSDGQRIVTSCWDGRIRVWHRSGVLLNSWEGHKVADRIGLTISPDGSLIASWGDWSDRTIRIWDAVTGDQRTCFTLSKVDDVEFSPDGQLIAAGRLGDAVHVWRVVDGLEIAALGVLSEGETVQKVCFSPDGQRLAAAVTSDVLIWDIATREELFRLRSNDGTVKNLSFSENGNTLLSAAAWDNGLGHLRPSGTTSIWDVTQRVPPRKFEGLAEVNSMVSDDGWYPVRYSLDTAIVSVTSGKPVAWFHGIPEQIQTDPTQRVCALSKGNRLYLFKLEGAPDSAATRLLEEPVPHAVPVLPSVPTPKVVQRELRNLINWVNDSRIDHEAICPVCGNGGKYGSGNYSTELRVYFGEGEPQTIERPITEIRIKCLGPAVHAADRDARHCTVGTGDGSGLYLLPSSRPDWHRERVCEYLMSIGSPFASHPSLDEVPTAKDSRSYFEWKAPLDAPQATNTSSAPEQCVPSAQQQDVGGHPDPLMDRSTPSQSSRRGIGGEFIFHGHEGAVYGAAFLANGLEISSAGSDGTVRTWNIESGHQILCCMGHSAGIYGLAISPNGMLAATASWDHSIGLWRGRFGRLWKRLEGHSNVVYGVAFSSDGQILASASEDRTIRLWDSATGSQVGCLRGHSRGAVCVAFSPDRRFLVSGGGDHTIRTWELQGAKEQEPYYGHTELVTQVRFSPDGQYLASASDDGTVHLRIIAGNGAVRILRGHNGWVLALAFSCDGTLLASGGQDEKIRIWNVLTAKESACLIGHEAAVRSITFSADGSRILSAAEDGTVRLWNLGK